MAEYIDKEKLIEHLLKTIGQLGEQGMTEVPIVMTLHSAVNDVKSFPTEDVQPLAHGKWLLHGWCCPCSNCKWDFGYAGTILQWDLLRKFKYCPNCGAKMEEQNVRKSNKG